MRSNVARVCLIILMPVVFCSPLFAASQGSIKGKVSDSEGSVIENAHVIFHADLAGRANQAAVLDQVRETDAAGFFEIQLDPGFYDVCIMAMAFSPECKKVLVTKSKASVDNAHLNVDPLVSEHLADKVLIPK